MENAACDEWIIDLGSKEYWNFSLGYNIKIEHNDYCPTGEKMRKPKRKKNLNSQRKKWTFVRN